MVEDVGLSSMLLLLGRTAANHTHIPIIINSIIHIIITSPATHIHTRTRTQAHETRVQGRSSHQQCRPLRCQKTPCLLHVPRSLQSQLAWVCVALCVQDEPEEESEEKDCSEDDEDEVATL